MPLHTLVDSVQTLANLIERSRELRGRIDLPNSTVEDVDRKTDETLNAVASLLRVIVEAHARGDLDAMVRKEEEGLRLGV
jgi:hypothetical protein